MCIRDSNLTKLRFSVVAKTDETYPTFCFGPLTFRDPCRHMQGSLSSCVEALCDKKTDDEDLRKRFPITAARHPNAEHISHLCRKYKMPFAAMRDRACLDDLPPVLDDPDMYYDKFKDEPVSAHELQQQRETAALLGCRTLNDLVRVYVMNDVLQMADVFETYRDKVIEFMGLDPAHYIGSPGLAMDGALWLTKAQFELVHEGNGGYELIDDFNRNTWAA